MKYVISHQSALEYWRKNRKLPGSSAERRYRGSLPDRQYELEPQTFSGFILPVHVLIGNRSARKRSKTIRQHLHSGNTPVGCFTNIGEKFIVCSPEFCFLQMANQLTLIRLIELGYELCGTYSLPVTGDPFVPERGFYNRPPLTSVKKLEVFLNHMQGNKGHVKVMRALRYMQNDSASPMETKLAIILTLPYKLGGFGLAGAELNWRVIPTKAAKRSSGKAIYVCDLFWADHNLAVEYDSNSFHTHQRQIADDSKKRNALTTMGITPITVTKQQLYDRQEFEKIARAIAKGLGKRLVFKNPGFNTAHNDLREQLQLNFD